jgi:hypothetical protein
LSHESTTSAPPRFAITGKPIAQTWENDHSDFKWADEWDDVVRKLQGSLVDTKRVMATLRKAGAAIRDSIDPYLQTTLFAGRASTRVADFAERKLRRLLTEMAMHKISQQPLADYPWARHAEEATRRWPGEISS